MQFIEPEKESNHSYWMYTAVLFFLVIEIILFTIITRTFS